MRFVCLALLVVACRPERLQIVEDDPRCSKPCWTNPNGTPGVGTCTEGTWECDEDGQLFECVGQGAWGVEVCDGLDNDCNGIIDDLPLVACFSPGNTGLGICHPGVNRCVDGVQNCANEQLPMVEICNGLDDDCNGVIDDGLGGVADVVVIADCTGEDFDDELRLNTAINDLANKYSGTANFALVCTTGPQAYGVVNLYQNFAQIRSFDLAVNDLVNSLDGGADDDDEPTLDALAMVADFTHNPLMLNWRVGSRRDVVMWTDECAATYTQPPIQVGDVATLVANDDLRVYIYAPQECQSTYEGIAIDGGYADMFATFPLRLEAQMELMLQSTCSQ